MAVSSRVEMRMVAFMVVGIGIFYPPSFTSPAWQDSKARMVKDGG
jgi:hypothetical protein